MKNHRIIIAATIVGLTVLASRAGAAISVTDGTLHVSAGSSAPLDVPFVQPGTSAGASDGGGMGWNPPPVVYAQERVSFVDAHVGISTDTYWWVPYGVVASGSLNITEDAPETMWVVIDPYRVSPLSYEGHVSLQAVGGDNLFDEYFYGDVFDPYRGPFEFLVPLSPGQYTLTWSAEGSHDVGVDRLAGYGGFDLTMGVPEPSSGLLLIAPAAMVFTRRRGRNLPTHAE